MCGQADKTPEALAISQKHILENVASLTSPGAQRPLENGNSTQL